MPPVTRRRVPPPPSAAATSARYLRVATAVCLDRGWPVPVAEHKFHPERRWRFDLAWPAYWLAVEIEGGLFSGGAHTRGQWLRREFEKLNEAQIRGWTVVLILPEQIRGGQFSAALAAYFTRWYPTAFPPER